MEEVRIITDSSVRNQDETRKIHAVNAVFKGFFKCQMVQCVSGEGFNGDRDARIIHEQPHLDDGELAFFLADAHLAQPFLDDISFFIKDILVRFADFEVKIGHIIIDDLGGAVRFFNQVRVDAPDDLVLVGMDEIQGIIDIIRVEPVKDRLVILRILPDGGAFGGGAKQPPEQEELGKAVNIVLYLT